MEQFKISDKKISHVGVIVKDVEASIKKAQEDFGLDPKAFRRDTIKDVPGWYHGNHFRFTQKMAFINVGGMEIEMIQPVSGDTCMMEFMKNNGNGMHHVGFVCRNAEEMEEIAQYLRDKGYDEIHLAREVGPLGDGDGYFFDTREALGVILEVAAPITMSQEMIDAGVYYPGQDD